MTATRPWCALALVALLAGCARQAPGAAGERTAEAVLAAARARSVPDPLQGRFSIRLRSKQLDVAGSTGGAIVLDPPGRGHVAIFGPLGGPWYTLTTDGDAVAVVATREQRHYVEEDADALVAMLVPGLRDVDELFGLLVGQVPLDDERLQGLRVLDDGRVMALLDGSGGVLVSVVLRPEDGTPASLVAQRGDDRLLAATFGAFQPGAGALLPTEVAVEVPSLDLRVDLSYRSWRSPDTPPDVFGLGAPPGFTSEPLGPLLRAAAAELPVFMGLVREDG